MDVGVGWLCKSGLLEVGALAGLSLLYSRGGEGLPLTDERVSDPRSVSLAGWASYGLLDKYLAQTSTFSGDAVEDGASVAGQGALGASMADSGCTKVLVECKPLVCLDGSI
jgi:hypothetical protein